MSSRAQQFAVTLIKGEVFLLGGWQLWQGVLYWQQFDLIEPYNPAVNTRILAAGAWAWAVLLLGTAVALQLKKRAILNQAVWVLTLFLLYITIGNILLFTAVGEAITQLIRTTLVLLLIGLNQLLNYRTKERE